MIEYRAIQKADVPAIMALTSAEQWPSYSTDAAFTWRVLCAPGTIAIVAEEEGKLVGFVQMETDGGVHAHLSSVLVAKTHRHRGIGTKLVKEAFAKTGAKWVNVLTHNAAGFYRSFVHRPWTGFRLYPQYDEDPGEQGAEGDAAGRAP